MNLLGTLSPVGLFIRRLRFPVGVSAGGSILGLGLAWALMSPAWAAPEQLRVATYNATLNRFDLGGELHVLLASQSFPSGKRVAEIVQRVRPDVLLLNEFDYSTSLPTRATQLMQDNFFNIAQAPDLAPVAFPYRYAGPVNTGLPSASDLDNNGVIDTSTGDEAYGNDALGFGRWPGQYGMAVFSKYPLLTAQLRSFQLFKWKDMPASVMPVGFYTPQEQNIFRLSSKNHWDLPINLGGGVVFHLLASHPTPPVFDGTEDRNGRRNHDEIRLWADYLSGNTYLKDDAGQSASLGPHERFVLCGDQNADPVDGQSFQQAIKQLLQHPRVDASYTPSSAGAAAVAAVGQQGNPAQDTANFGGGNLRADYVLPGRAGWKIQSGGVFWPLPGQPGATAIGVSDHRLVWMDLVPVPVLSDAITEFSTASPSPAGGNAAAHRLRITWTGKPTYRYAVESASDLGGPWTTVITGLEGPAANTNAWVFETGDLLAGGRVFYRVAVGFP